MLNKKCTRDHQHRVLRGADAVRSRFYTGELVGAIGQAMLSVAMSIETQRSVEYGPIGIRRRVRQTPELMPLPCDPDAGVERADDEAELSAGLEQPPQPLPAVPRPDAQPGRQARQMAKVRVPTAVERDRHGLRNAHSVCGLVPLVSASARRR